MIGDKGIKCELVLSSDSALMKTLDRNNTFPIG